MRRERKLQQPTSPKKKGGGVGQLAIAKVSNIISKLR
jgi:hypothetical protein